MTTSSHVDNARAIFLCLRYMIIPCQARGRENPHRMLVLVLNEVMLAMNGNPTVWQGPKFCRHRCDGRTLCDEKEFCSVRYFLLLPLCPFDDSSFAFFSLVTAAMPSLHPL